MKNLDYNIEGGSTVRLRRERSTELTPKSQSNDAGGESV
jgi:hypothetical protein